VQISRIRLFRTEAAEPVLDASGSVERQPAASADERKLLIATLQAVKGDRKTAAELLGISLKTVYNRLKHYGLDQPTLPGGRARGS